MLFNIYDSAGTLERILSEEKGASGKLLLGGEVRSEAEPLITFTSVLLDCKKNPFLSIKVRPSLDRIGYLLNNIIN